MTAISSRPGLLRRTEKVETTAFRRGAIGIVIFAAVWELGTRLTGGSASASHWSPSCRLRQRSSSTS